MSVNASDGVLLDLDDLPITMSYTSSKLTYIQVLYRGKTYRQTFTYTGDDCTGISNFVLQ